MTLRFAVASDFHWSQNNPDVSPGGYSERVDALITALEAEKTADGLDFVVINGDLIHDTTSDLGSVKTKLDTLSMDYYVNYGNHDRETDANWNTLWGYNQSHSFVVGDYAFICPSTSNTSGDYLTVDTTWLQNQINSYSTKDGIFVICHIPQDTTSVHGVDGSAVRAIFEATDNLIGVIYSHAHDEGNVYLINDVKYCRTGHFGNWGLEYYSYRIFEVN